MLAGGAHSSTPITLAGVLQKGMEQLKAVHTEAEQAGITSLGTKSSPHALLLAYSPLKGVSSQSWYFDNLQTRLCML